MARARCVLGAAVESLRAGEGREGEVAGEAGRGLLEYWATGDIRHTWSRLRHVPHLNTLVTCLHSARDGC